MLSFHTSLPGPPSVLLSHQKKNLLSLGFVGQEQSTWEQQRELGVWGPRCLLNGLSIHPTVFKHNFTYKMFTKHLAGATNGGAHGAFWSVKWVAWAFSSAGLEFCFTRPLEKLWKHRPKRLVTALTYGQAEGGTWANERHGWGILLFCAFLLFFFFLEPCECIYFIKH